MERGVTGDIRVKHRDSGLGEREKHAERGKLDTLLGAPQSALAVFGYVPSCLWMVW